MKQKTYRWTVAALAATFALAGCGGGGGGGGSSSGGGGGVNNGTVTITGQLKEQGHGYVLPNRIVAVKGTSSKGTSDANGRFTIPSARAGSLTLVIKDNVGALNGEVPVTVSGSGTRDVGVITLDLSRIPPPPF